MSPLSQCLFPKCSPVSGLGLTAPTKTHNQLLGLTHIDLEEVPLALDYKVLYQFSVLCVILLRDEADECKIIRELLQVTGSCVLSEVHPIECEV